MEACGGDAISYGIGEVNDPPYAEAEGGGDVNCGYDMGGEPFVMDWADITGDVIYEKKFNFSSNEVQRNLITVSFKLLVNEMELELGRRTGGRRIIGRSPLGGIPV